MYDDDYSGTHGFWWGMLVGLVLAALFAAMLAWFFPPVIFAPPVIAPEATTAPGGAAGPDGADGPAPVQSGGVLPEMTPAPAKAGGPGREKSPSLFKAAPLPSPALQSDAPSGRSGIQNGAAPLRPQTGGALPAIAPAPGNARSPALGAPLGGAGISQPPAAPDVFDGGASGSPSLVPQAQE